MLLERQLISLDKKRWSQAVGDFKLAKTKSTDESEGGKREVWMKDNRTAGREVRSPGDVD